VALAEVDRETLHDSGPHGHTDYQFMEHFMLKGTHYVKNNT
jgi:hypothetical protein